MTCSLWWRIAKCLGFAIILGVVYSVGVLIGSLKTEIQYNSSWPNLPNCQLTVVSRYPSEDGADVATILERYCGSGDRIDYFLRLDIHERRSGHPSWWRIVVLENDQRPEKSPTVAWIKNTTVQVTISTSRLSGTLVESELGDIKLVRVYEPREPEAFPK